MMGLDEMKKDAVYDSLIDASKIVQEEGADLRGSIKSGTLQNRIIQAISKQLDKSPELKKQIDDKLGGTTPLNVILKFPSSKIEKSDEKKSFKY